jgi:hypothetical protein
VLVCRGVVLGQVDVAQSRRVIAERFGVIESEVRKIEQEGIENNWPPLD